MHEIEQSLAALSLLRQGNGGNGFPVRSLIAGQVLCVLQASEVNVVAGTPLLELGDIGRLEIVAELLSTDAPAARHGNLVRIGHWGGSGQLLGYVRRVAPSAFSEVSALRVEEQRVRVLISIDSPRDQWKALGDGFRVGVSSVTLAQDGMLQASVSAVFPLPAKNDQAAPVYAVFVADGARARLAPVELAARNSNSAWLRAGVGAGFRVIVYPGAAVPDGARIRERKV